MKFGFCKDTRFDRVLVQEHTLALHYGTLPVAGVLFAGELSVGLVLEGPRELTVELLVIFEVAVETRTVQEFHSGRTLLEVVLKLPFVFCELWHHRASFCPLEIVTHHSLTMPESFYKSSLIEITSN